MSGSVLAKGVSEIVFKSDNKIGTMMRFNKASPLTHTDDSKEHNIGTCAALSSIWLKNMFTYIKPGVTKPNQGEAAMRFAKNWMTVTDVDAFNRKNMTDSGLSAGTRYDYNTLTEMFEDIAHVGGYYYIDTQQGHIVAAVKRGTDCFFYDSNVALYQFKWTDFAKKATQKLVAEGFGDDYCMIYEVTQS